MKKPKRASAKTPARRPGRPVHAVPNDLIAAVGELMERGATFARAIEVNGIPHSTAYAWLEQGRADPDRKSARARFAAVVDKGRAKVLAAVENALVSKALDGDVAAQKFILMTQSREQWAPPALVAVTAGSVGALVIYAPAERDPDADG